MKQNMLSVACLVALLPVTSCEKELSTEGSSVHLETAKAFNDFVGEKKFRLTAFYSNTPIDYIEDDGEVRAETNLWSYVSGYLKDDINIFYTDNTVDVVQNEIKIPGIDDAVLPRTYSIGASESGAYIRFLDYQYNALQYNLESIGDNYFIVYVPWKDGVRLYSRFDLMP